MLRTSVFRAARAASRPCITRIAVTPAHTYNHFIRFESTKAEEPSQTDAAKAAWRKARDFKDKLNHNWDAVTLTYEQVKPKTLSPSSVRPLFPSSLLVPLMVWTRYIIGRISNRRTGTRRSYPRLDPFRRQPPSLRPLQLSAPPKRRV